MERVGVEIEDLFKSSNDGCTVAVKAGRLTVGGDRETMNRRVDDVKDGCCDMHIASLMTGLATTLVQRTVAGRVMNKWPAFHDLFGKTKSLGKHLCDRKNKGRFDKYKKFISNYDGSAVVVIPIPNKTRVSGAYILIQATLRSMHALRIYSFEDSSLEKKLLELREWGLLAQFEAIMKPAHDFCFDVQGDRIELACDFPLLLAYLKNQYETVTSYNVMDTTQKWRANVPVIDIPRIDMDLEQLQPEAKELVNRYIASIDEYFGLGKVNTDRCKFCFIYVCQVTVTEYCFFLLYQQWLQ